MSRKEKIMLLKSYKAAIDYIESILPKEEPLVKEDCKVLVLKKTLRGKQLRVG